MTERLEFPIWRTSFASQPLEETLVENLGSKANASTISRLRDGASVAYWVHTPEMVGFDSHSRYQFGMTT